MGLHNPEPSESVIQFEIVKERLKFSEEKILQLEQVIAQANRNLGQKEAVLEQLRDERDDLRIKWRVLQRDFKYTQDLVTQYRQKTTKKRNSARSQAFLASVLFLITTILVNIGTTQLTSTPPNLVGWVMIALATTAYIVAALMTTLLALEGGSL